MTRDEWRLSRGQDELITQIIDGYTSRRRKQYPEFQLTIKARNSGTWGKVAEHIRTCEYTVDDYLDAAFQLFSPYPPLNVLASDKIVRSVSPLREATIGNARTYLINMNALFKRYTVELGKPARDVIQDPDLYFSSLFRFVVSYQLGYEDLVEKYREAARKTLELYPHFGTLMSEWLPEEI